MQRGEKRPVASGQGLSILLDPSRLVGRTREELLSGVVEQRQLRSLHGVPLARAQTAGHMQIPNPGQPCLCQAHMEWQKKLPFNLRWEDVVPHLLRWMPKVSRYQSLKCPFFTFMALFSSRRCQWLSCCVLLFSSACHPGGFGVRAGRHLHSLHAVSFHRCVMPHICCY